MKQKDGFLLYCTQWDLISMLSMEQRGECITAIFEYAVTCKLPEVDDPLVRMAFVGIAGQMERDNAKYFEKCDKNRENANKLWEQKRSDRKQTDATAYDCKRPHANDADKDKDKDNDNDKDMDKERDITRACAREDASGGQGGSFQHREGSFPQGQYKNVRITEAEREGLINDLGEATVNSTIERLSEYIQIHGDKYADHCAVVKKWAREDAANKDGSSSDFDEDEYFAAALARSERYLEENREKAADSSEEEQPP